MIVLQTLARAAIALVVAAAAGVTGAQGVKPIRIVVPYGPGGTADQTARIVGQKMSATLGQPVVIENRPGAGAVTAAVSVAKAEPDGNTLLLIGNSSAVTPLLYKSLPYDVFKDFSYVGSICYFDFGVIVPGDSPFNTVADLLAWAKANPGKLNLATLTPGTGQNLTGELFRSTSGVQLQIVPFKATGEAITAVRAKEVHAAIEVVAPLMGQIQSGHLKVLGVASTQPLQQLPKVPPIAATLPGFSARSWNGLAAPARTPVAVIERLNKAMDQAFADPEVKQKLLALGVEPVSMSPEETRAQIETDMRKWKVVIDQAGIAKQ
jgi:tripartite-type tricarboxylate transporter receptor subunit TctC